jgi:alpha-galactosidase
MTTFLLQYLFFGVLTLLGVTLITYALVDLAPGDPISAMISHAYEDAPLHGEYIDELDADEEEVIDILTSIRGDRDGLFYVNLPNRGQVNNLPPDVVVKTRAIADAKELHALVQPPLTARVIGTLMPHYPAVETIVAAAIEGSRDKFIQALVVDGSVDSMQSAAALANELLQGQGTKPAKFLIVENMIGLRLVSPDIWQWRYE